jgi:predicted methyltransferase
MYVRVGVVHELNMSGLGQTALDPDDLCSLLANDGRRVVLTTLLERETTTIDHLVSRLAATRSTDESPDRTTLKITLVHNHLPRLADHGVIEYDHRNGDVVLTERGKELEAAFEVLESQSLTPVTQGTSGRQ